MANVTILQLPVAVTIDGSEYFPLVQGGTDKRATTGLVLGGGGPQDANTFLAGPTSGAADTATFRTIVNADLASGATSTYILTAGASAPAWTNPSALGVDLDIGSTTITSGTTTRILYDNAGVLGEYTISGSGTVVAMAASPVFTTPTLGVAIGTSLALGGATIGSNALAVTGGIAGSVQIWSGSVSTALQTLTGAGDGFRASAANVTQFAGENTTTSSSTAGALLGAYSNDGAAMASGDRLGGLRAGGSSSASALRNSAIIAAYAAEAWADGSAYGSRWEFQTTTNLATTATTKLILSNAGVLALGATLANTVPALKPSSTSLQARLGDDSAFTDVSAASFTLNGSSSGAISILPQAAAGTYNFNLPTTAGTSGYVLTSAGGASSPMTWTNPSALGIDLDVGTTAIVGGTTTRVLYDNAGVLGEYAQVPIANGGTNGATAAAGFDNLAPTTTRGDLIFRNATVNTRLAASTSGYLLQTNGAGTDPTWEGFLQAGSGATTRTWRAKARDIVSVKDFGATGDGVTDDTAAITAAMAAVNTNNEALFFPAGTYMVTGLTWKSGVVLQGDGKLATIIKLITGSNTYVIVSDGAAALFGTNSTGGIEGGGIEDLCIDGNSAGQSSGTGLGIYGDQFNLERLLIRDCKEYGIRSEWAQYGEEHMEARVSDVEIDTTGSDGFWWKGPHDSIIENAIVVDAGQTTDNTYSGFLVQDYGASQFKSIHAWHRSTVTNRMKYSVNNEAYGATFVDPHCEGAKTAQLRCAGQYATYLGGKAYASFNAAPNILITQPCSVRATFCGGEAAGQSAAAAVQLGTGGGGENPAAIDVDVYIGATAGAVCVFTNDAGKNFVRLRGFCTAPFITGSPHATTSVDIDMWGSDRYTNTLNTRFVNLTDSASVEVAKFEGDRASPADFDQANIGLYLSDSAGTQKNVANIAWQAPDVTAGTDVDGLIYFGVMVAGVANAQLLVYDGSALYPYNNDSMSLGTTGSKISDLFLASGSVINWNSGDVTLTHSANLLTLDGGGFVFNDAGADLDWRMEGDADANLFFLDASVDFIGIGASAPKSKLQVSKNAATVTPTTNTLISFVGVDGDNAIVEVGSYGTGFAPSVQGRAARGTGASPTASQADDQLLGVGGLGYGATAFNTSSKAKVGLHAAENWDDSVQGTYIAFSTTPIGSTTRAEAARLTGVKNLKIAGTAVRGTTEGTNHLDIFDGTAPAGTLTNGVSFYSASGEARVMDAAGNSTLLSPHDKKTNEWIYHSVDTRTGKGLRIDMERMLRAINERFGWDFVHEFVDGE